MATYRDQDTDIPAPVRPPPTDKEASIATLEHESWGNWRIGTGIAFAVAAFFSAPALAAAPHQAIPVVVSVVLCIAGAMFYAHRRAEKNLDIMMRHARASKDK